MNNPKDKKKLQQNQPKIFQEKPEIFNLNLDSLDVEELENRLSMVKALPPTGCWIFGEF